jgi:hypothetical protein
MFNNIMSGLRVSVENIMAKQTNLFKLIDYSKTQKLQQCPLVQQFTVSMFLVNCRSCLYGNQVSYTFGMSPPLLERESFFGRRQIKDLSTNCFFYRPNIFFSGKLFFYIDKIIFYRQIVFLYRQNNFLRQIVFLYRQNFIIKIY